MSILFPIILQNGGRFFNKFFAFEFAIIYNTIFLIKSKVDNRLNKGKK